MDGTVVYVNSNSKASNYGRYVVVHHDFGSGPFFSLYAHNASELVRQILAFGRRSEQEQQLVAMEEKQGRRFGRWVLRSCYPTG